MTKKFWLDTILGTAFVFFLMFLAMKVFDKLDVLDPIGEAIGDMEITDMVFSRLREHPGAETDIVLVNIGHLNRAQIARQIDILNKYKPKVLAIDVFFRNELNTKHDSLLAASFAATNNLILASKISGYNNDNDTFENVETSHPIFNQYAHNAYANFITEAEEQEQFKTCRTFSPKERTLYGEQHALAVKICQLYAPDKAAKFLKRENNYEIINFRGNVLYEEGDFAHMFSALDVEDVLNENFVPEMIENKIIIMGYMGSNFNDKSWQDKFYTPMNMDYAGKANPDMFGVVVHANIVSMILKGKFIEEMGSLTTIIAAVLLCFVNVFFFCIIYQRLPRWYDGLTKIIQVVEVIILFGLIVAVFYLFDYKLNLTVGIIAILLSGDSLEAYFGVIKNLFSQKGWKRLKKIHGMQESKDDLYAENAQ